MHPTVVPNLSHSRLCWIKRNLIISRPIEFDCKLITRQNNDLQYWYKPVTSQTVINKNRTPYIISLPPPPTVIQPRFSYSKFLLHNNIMDTPTHDHIMIVGGLVGVWELEIIINKLFAQYGNNSLSTMIAQPKHNRMRIILKANINSCSNKNFISKRRRTHHDTT